MSKKTMAVIEIASNELRLKIGEKKGEGFKITELLSYPLSLGKDSFHYGKISFESMCKASDIINGFLKVAEEYGVDKIATIATTAVREASNKDYVLDRIRIKTGLDINVVDDNQEKNYINTLMFSLLPKKYTKSAIVVHLGSGNIGIFRLENACITFTRIIKIGGLRLSEKFDTVGSEKYFSVVREYLSPFLDSVIKLFQGSVNDIILTGQDAAIISKLCNGKEKGDYTEIDKDNFTSFYNQLRDKTPSELQDKTGISVETQELLLPALVMYNRFLKHSGSDKIIALPITAGDCLLLRLVNPERYSQLKKQLEESSLISAMRIAKRYEADTDHVKKLESCCLLMFDKLSSLHGLDKRKRFLLQMTAILHNIGKFVNPKHHYIHSYNIISGLDIVGISDEEKHIIATTALFHSTILPDANNPAYGELSPENRAIVSKLCAILRLSSAINSGSADKYDKISMKLKGNEFIITLETYKDIDLEEIMFASKSELFADVYGIKAILKKRSVI